MADATVPRDDEPEEDIAMHGPALRNLRGRRGLTQEGLASRLGISRGRVALWELGREKPSRRVIIDEIGAALRLGPRELNSLLRVAGYSSLAPSDMILRLRRSETEVVGGPSSGSPMVGYVEPLVPWATMRNELQTQIGDLQSSIEALAGSIGQTTPSEPGDESLTVAEEVQSLKATLAELQATSQQLTAPVDFPRPEEMRQTLVPSMWLHQLEEYRQEQTKWYAWLGVIGGALLGIAINVVTGGEMTPAASVLVSAFLIIGAAAGWSAITYQRRAAPLRDRILGPSRPESGSGAQDEEGD